MPYTRETEVEVKCAAVFCVLTLEQSIRNAPSLACPDYFQLISSSYGSRMVSENFFSPKIYLKAEWNLLFSYNI